MDAQDQLGRHPLGIAAQVLRAVGALMSGGLLVFALTIAFCLAKSASAFQTAMIAGGVVLVAQCSCTKPRGWHGR